MDEQPKPQAPTPEQPDAPLAPHPAPVDPAQAAASQPVSTPEPHNNVSGSSGQPSWWREILSTIGILVLAFGVALLLISFVFRSYQVDGPSMQSTLQNNDKLIIWKVPRTWARITGHNYIPKRGDIIVFNESGLAAYGQADTKQLIKRVIGLPGDRVVVNNGVLTIFNKAHPNGFQPDQTLPYNSDHHIPVTDGYVDVTLGANQLFVCGDNRPDSLDSRRFGPINANQVVGQLVLRVLPINQVKAF